jgi:hypothetical protein
MWIMAGCALDHDGGVTEDRRSGRVTGAARVGPDQRIEGAQQVIVAEVESQERALRGSSSPPGELRLALTHGGVGVAAETAEGHCRDAGGLVPQPRGSIRQITILNQAARGRAAGVSCVAYRATVPRLERSAKRSVLSARVSRKREQPDQRCQDDYPHL